MTERANLPHNYYASSRLPLSAFLVLKIGDRIYDFDDKKFLTSFTMNKMPNEAHAFTIGLNNITDPDLEDSIGVALVERHVVSFQYGHSEGLRSGWLKGYLLDYTPTFQSDMSMIIAVSGVTMYDIDDGNKATYNVSSYSDLVRKIIADEGWTPKIIFDTPSFGEQREFTRTGEAAFTFLYNRIKDAVSAENMPMVLNSLNSTEHDREIYFVPIDYDMGNMNKTYIINPSIHSPVLSFTPGYQGMSTAQQRYRYDSGFIVDDTNELERVTNGDGDTDVSGTIVRSAVGREEMGSLVASKWFEMNVGHVEATMSLIGDPELNVMEQVNIIPIRPDGKIHHTKGRYQITKIDEDVSGGNYTTTLTLIKMPSSVPSPEIRQIDEGIGGA